MAFLRELGDTGLTVSALGLGTVKIGRDQGVKYPTPFSIPDDDAVRDLLARARELGINLIDTAPAYGRSEERLGHLLPNRQDWVIVSKVGEEFSDGDSHFDFSPAHTRASVERSLRRLNTDYLDCVLIHSDGNDLDVLRSGALETLEEMKTGRPDPRHRHVHQNRGRRPGSAETQRRGDGHLQSEAGRRAAR